MRINYHVDLEGLENVSLFFAGTPESLDLRARALYRSEGSVYHLGHPLPEGLHYDVYSLLESRPEAASPIVPAPVLPLAARERALQLPLIDQRIPVLARTFTAGAATDLERARAIESSLRTDYGYTLDLPDRDVVDPLAFFLFTRKKGYCEYFASSMAIMLRSIGIPSRLATGFQSGIYNPVSDQWLVRASDAHSWVEAWIPGRGWTTFDPTPPDPSALSGPTLSTRLALYLDAAETFWQEWVVTYDIARQGLLAGRVEQGAHRLGIRWFDAVLAVRSSWDRYTSGGALPRPWVLAPPLVGILMWTVGRPLLRRFRIRRRVARVRRGHASLGDATLLYERMLHLLKRKGFQKPPWFTPAEFAASLPPIELAGTVRDFTLAYNALRFGRRSQATARLSALLDRLERS